MCVPKLTERVSGFPARRSCGKAQGGNSQAGCDRRSNAVHTDASPGNLPSTYGCGWDRDGRRRCRRAAERSGLDTDGLSTRVGTVHWQPRSRGRHAAEGRQVHRFRFFLIIPVIGLPQQLLELFQLLLLRGGRCERCTTTSTVVRTTATGWTHPRRSRPGPSDGGHLPRRAAVCEGRALPARRRVPASRSGRPVRPRQ